MKSRFGTLCVLVFLVLESGCSAPERQPAPAKPIKPPCVFVQAKHFEPANREADYDIDTIVIHTTEGAYDSKRSFAENQAENYRRVVRYFADTRDGREVSAHYVVGPKGEITQMVLDKDIAWHATYYNRRSIGIENAGWANRPETWTPELLESLARLVAYLALTYGVPIEHPTETAVDHGGFFKGRGIIGHYQVQTAGSGAVKYRNLAVKTDPGPFFPWERFVRRVREIADKMGR